MEPSLVLSLGMTSKSQDLASYPAPHTHIHTPYSQVSPSGVCQAVALTIFESVSLHFALLRLAAVIFSKALKLSFCPPDLSTSQRASQCMETFPFSQLPPRGAGPVLIPFSLFSSSTPLLSYPVMWRFSCSFGSLRSFVSIQ